MNLEGFKENEIDRLGASGDDFVISDQHIMFFGIWEDELHLQCLHISN